MDKPRFKTVQDFLTLLQDVKEDTKKANHWMAKCPTCDDKHRHLSINLDQLTIGLHCFHGCANETIMAHFGLELAHLFLADPNKPKRGPGRPAKSDKVEPKKVANYAYRDEQGIELFRKIRIEPAPDGGKKSFYQETPDGGRDLTGIRRVIYNLPNVLKEKGRAGLIAIVEGEKDVGTLNKLGITATCNPEGCNKWDESYSESLRDGDCLIIPDQDKPGLIHGLEVAQSLNGVARRVRILNLPDGYKDVSEWVEAGHTKADFLENLLPLAQVFKREGLEDIVACAKKWLYLEDADSVGSVLIVMGAVAGNKVGGDPIWLVVLGPPAVGKTEVIRSIAGVKDVWPVSVLSEASLLSGTSRKEAAPGAKGGILNEMGSFGILTIKDFGGIMAMNRDSRGTVLAALREVYDGSWTRLVGAEGGRALSWKGKCGLVAGATPAIDTQYAIMGILGERFNYYRLPDLPDDKVKARADKALAHAGDEDIMRSELSGMVTSFFSGFRNTKPRAFTNAERDKLTALATFASRCRSPVERDSYRYQDILNIPGAEAPNRMVKVLGQLARGLWAIGVDYQKSWHLVEKTAIDSMTKLREKVITGMLLVYPNNAVPTQDIATLVGYPTNTARRVLEDLSCYEIVDRITRGSEGGSSTSDTWQLTDWTRDLYARATVELPQDIPCESPIEVMVKPNDLPEKQVYGHNNNNSSELLNNTIHQRISSKSISKNLGFSFVCGNCKGRKYWVEYGSVKKCATCWTAPEGADIFEDD